MKKRIAALLLCLVLGAAVITAAGAAKVHAEGEQYTVTFSLNDGTGSQVYHTATAAPGEPIAFPADPTREGFIFKGWYDTPNVETPLKEDNSIKSLTPTGNTTLYALWMDKRLDIPIGIGINLRYHCEGSTYWYPGISKALNAYQTLPNEPATIEHAALRTWKKDGQWIILSNNNEAENGLGNDYYSARLGKAYEFVRWDFFTSPDMHLAGDGTYGIADASGGKVRSVLSLTQEDYDAIAAGWIAWAKDPVNSFSAGEGYNDGWNNNALSKIDWQDESIVASDYKAVPYVVKYQTRGNILVWFIDMIIAPKNKYTLSYDRNLEPGFYLPANQPFPQNSTYHEGEIAQVVLDPNVKPTNGTDTATFQYWVDDEGNKYGKGYITSIPMWSDKVLYAIWEYPDRPTLGSLRFSKTVINADKDNPSPAETEFTFRAGLKDKSGVPLTGEYAYRIYNAYSQQVNVGDGADTSLANGDTFKLRDGWDIIIDHLPGGAVCTISEESPAHYTAPDLPRSAAIVAGNTVPLTAENIYAPDGYHIAEHYYQNTLGQYPAVPDLRETFSGKTGSPAAKPTEEFRLDHTTEVTVDGVRVYRFYYDRLNRYPLVVRYLDRDTGLPLLEPAMRPGDIEGYTAYEFAPEIPGYHWEQSVGECVIRQETEDPNDADSDYALTDIKNNIITFYYTRNKLTIKRANAAAPVVDVDRDQVFVYEVKNTDTNAAYTVTVVGNGSATIYGIPFGHYTVTQVDDWSWRYDDGQKQITVNQENHSSAAVTFDDAVADNKWLDGNSPQIDNVKTGGGG